MEVLNINMSSETFNTTAGNCLIELYKDQESTDVTLACGDDQQFKAHKAVLGFCSSVFKNIFRTNNAPNQVVYFRGVEGVELKSILEFMYTGKTTINQTCLDNFLAIARDIKVKGLGELPDNNSNKNSNIQNKNKDETKLIENSASTKCIKEGHYDTNNFLEHETVETQSMEPIVYVSENHENEDSSPHTNVKETEPAEIKTVTKDLIIPTTEEKQQECVIPRSSQKALYKWRPDWTIKDCYSLSGRDLYDLMPDENGLFSCTDCSYKQRARLDVARHCLSRHVNLKLECDDCTQHFRGFNSLQHHKRIVHEGVQYVCDNCPYKGNTRNNLHRHIIKYH